MRKDRSPSRTLVFAKALITVLMLSMLTRVCTLSMTITLNGDQLCTTNIGTKAGLIAPS